MYCGYREVKQSSITPFSLVRVDEAHILVVNMTNESSCTHPMPLLTSTHHALATAILPSMSTFSPTPGHNTDVRLSNFTMTQTTFKR